MGEEKRIYPRFKFKRPAQCAHLDTFPEGFNVTVVDISPDGIGFICDEKLNAGNTVYFILDLGNGESVKFLIKIRWRRNLPNSDRFHIGAKIYEASKTDMEKFVRVYYKHLVPRSDKQKKVLIIEHDRSTLNALQAELTKRKYDVICAQDGESGYAKYLSEQPDLVILNVVLSKLDGYSVCRNIRKLQADSQTPIIMLTAKKKAAEKAVKDGMDIQKFFVKPFEMERMLVEIAQLMFCSGDENE